jgi:pSer/pThr/pTyr-binding forkhead associated (FHA) protein
MYKLEVRENNRTALVFILREGTHSVGRNTDNDIVLTDASVSRSHCLVYVRPDLIEVQDLESANGVKVGGKLVKGRVEVQFNEEFLIGEASAYVRAADFETASETTIFHHVDMED